MEDKQLTVEDFKQFMETEEGRKVLNPMFDSKVSTAINTWKTNNLDKVIDEELVKRGYVQTEEQKQMMELKKELENIKQEKIYAELKTVKMAELSAHGLDASLAKYITADNEEGIRDSVNYFKGMIDAQVTKGIEKALANSGAKPEGKKKQEDITKYDLSRMTYAERMKLKSENPTLFNQLIG